MNLPLEFARIVQVVTGLAVTPGGAEELTQLSPSGDPKLVAERLNATSETVAYLQTNAAFGLRAGSGLGDAWKVLLVQGQPLEPLPLRTVAEFLDSIDTTRAAIRNASGSYPILTSIAARGASFRRESEEVRRAIDASGEVLDQASATLRSLREQLRTRRARLRSTLESFARGRDTAKYLQEQVVTERNGRSVLMIRAEHRSNVPGIVHGSSASGATLFLEPAAAVELNNDIVEIEEREREEIFRILLALTDAFRARPDELEATRTVATELDVLQAKARLGALVGGITPDLAVDGRFELRAARHPLLIREICRRLEIDRGASAEQDVVPTDIVLEPPTRVLLITGPNTGGKTVAIKTAGLLALMAQAGLQVPAAAATLPVFRRVFADIGDEQSISASLSTFSGHIANIVAMERQLELPALVILDEVGTGTDPNEGGALATAIVSHFQQRGAHVIATTHYDALKTWGTASEGVTTAAFAFDARNFAPTYKLIYGAPGRSLAIEIAQRLGLPLAVVASARGFLSDDQKRLAAHLERVDAQARALESDRSKLQRDRRVLEEANASLGTRERDLAAREERLAKRLNEKLDDRVRQARRDIDLVIEQLKERSDALITQASTRTRSTTVSTGDTGAARTDAREAIDQIVQRLREPDPAATSSAPAVPATVGARVAISAFGMEGTIVALSGNQAEIDVRGKKLRAPVSGLRVLSGSSANPPARPSTKVRVNVDLQPREGLLSELNVIGATVDQAIDRINRFLDDTLVTDQQQVRIVHGHGTGQLRRGIANYLKDHPLVAKFYPAPREQGGDGATVVELRE